MEARSTTQTNSPIRTQLSQLFRKRGSLFKNTLPFHLTSARLSFCSPLSGILTSLLPFTRPIAAASSALIVFAFAAYGWLVYRSWFGDLGACAFRSVLGRSIGSEDLAGWKDASRPRKFRARREKAPGESAHCKMTPGSNSELSQSHRALLRRVSSSEACARLHRRH